MALARSVQIAGGSELAPSVTVPPQLHLLVDQRSDKSSVLSKPTKLSSCPSLHQAKPKNARRVRRALSATNDRFQACSKHVCPFQVLQLQFKLGIIISS